MKKKVGIIKRALALALIFLLSINSFATSVSDNDGSAFITKAEFDALKSSFQSQIDTYNQSIDSKIDTAIASYLAGISMDKEVICTDNYNKLKAQYGFYWGNMLVKRNSQIEGGCNAYLQIGDEVAGMVSTGNYTNVVTTNCYASDRADCKVIHMAVYKEKLAYNESINYYFAQGTHQTAHPIAIETSSIFTTLKGAHPTRNGELMREEKFQTGRWPEDGVAFMWLTESFAVDSTDSAIFSINCEAAEYVLPTTGYKTSKSKTKTTYDAKASVAGTYGYNGSWMMRKVVTAEWGQNMKHNDLIISEWKTLTGKDEKIKTGMPVTYVSKKGDINFKVKAGVEGNLYAYCDASPKDYLALVDNAKDIRVIALTAGDEKEVELKECQSATWLRIAFLPTNAGDATILDITSDIKLTISDKK